MGAVDAELSVLRSFTAGLRRTWTPVVAGLTLEYHSGAVEGT
jgi:transposase